MVILYLSVLMISIGVGFFYLKKLTPAYRIMLILLMATWATEFVSHYVSSIGAKWVYSVYAVVSAMLYALIFRYLLNKTYHKLWNVGVSVMSTFFLFELSRLHKIVTFPSEMVTFSIPILIIFSFALFNQIINSNIEKALSQRTEFLFNSMFIIYMSINFMHLAFYEYFLQNKLSKVWSQNIHTATSIIYYLSFALIFYKTDSTKRKHDQL